MKNYELTIGYTAVINVSVKCENEEEAKKLALQSFNAERNKWYRSKSVNLQDDTYKVAGIVDMDETWNKL